MESAWMIVDENGMALATSWSGDRPMSTGFTKKFRYVRFYDSKAEAKEALKAKIKHVEGWKNSEWEKTSDHRMYKRLKGCNVVELN